MRTLKNWTAKRAGAKMTIYAMEDGKAVRITQVDKITGQNGEVIATTMLKEQLRLI